ncbi:MAG: hypothetical protein HQK65_18065 [Desulfamplus sp.]|nr:hypothetical protein [Desulfamplus sp.]
MTEEIWKSDDPYNFITKQINKYENGKYLPFPAIIKMTSFLKQFDKNPNSKQDNKNPVTFPVRLFFKAEDNSSHEFTLTLPEYSKEEGHSKANKILAHFLNCMIVNYGMTHQYKKVDIDFSASKDFAPGEIHPWHKLMNEIHGEKGLLAFDKYLHGCGTDVLEKSFSRKIYEDVIQMRELTEIHEFQSNLVCKEIKDKFILGIDIGGMGIKFQVYQIKTENNNNKILCSVDEKPSHYLEEKKQYSHKINTEPPQHETANTVFDEKTKQYKYKNADTFANYMVDALKTKLSSEWKSFLENLICVGFCWPGPIRQNKICGTSGTLKKFSGITGVILKDERSTIDEIDIASAIKKSIKEAAQNAKIQYTDVSVRLINDGDAEAVGLIFSESQEEPQYKTFFEKNNFAIIKAGTGTGGAVIVKNKILGLNEFGKILLDLIWNNKVNDGKKLKERYPVGDANKKFSMTYLKDKADSIGLKNKGDIDGYDIKFILESNTTTQSDFSYDQKRCFGALQLVQIAQPNLNLNDFLENGKIKGDIGRLDYSSDGFSIHDNNSSKNEVSPDALVKILNETVFKLHANLPNPMTLEDLILKCKIEHILPNPMTLDDLLLALGEYRINRIGFKPEHKKQFSTLGEELGRNLADIAETIRYLYFDYNIKAFIVSGGFIKGEIGEGCQKGFEGKIPEYISDRYNNKEKNNLISNNLPSSEDVDNYKIYYYSNKYSDYGLLGTAIIGFDHYIYEKKISELQKINKDAISTGKIPNDKKFLTQEEKNKFIEKNKEKLRVFLSEPKEFQYTPNKFEKELINCLKELTSLSFNTDSDLPPILVSFETPPIFNEYPGLEEEYNNRDNEGKPYIVINNEQTRINLSIEGLLGCYKSDSQKIVIYQRGINWCIKREGFRQECLFAVVLIHEIGHWITHVPPNGKTNPAWPTNLYDQTEKEVHEGWAQLITWWVADKAGREQFKETFEKLNKIQSYPYRVFEKFKEERSKIVMQSLKNLRVLNKKATLDDWKAALKQSEETPTT